jgi:CelD/BcsL family acetyltransferase involved in cellulose biosynthesis
MTPAADLQNGREASQSGTDTAVRVRRVTPDFPAADTAVGKLALQIRIARSPEEIQALASAWDRLERRAATPCFFQSHAWCAHVIAILEKGPAGGGLRPFVMTAWRGEGLVAVWPLQLRREYGARVLTDLTSPFGQYAGVLMAADATHDAEETCHWLLDQARRLSRADALVLRKVRADTPLGRVLAASGHVLDAPQWAPFVSMAGFSTFEAYHATTKAKTRKNVRNATHRLEKIGTVTHRVERRSGQMDAALANCFDLRSTWLESKGLTSTAFAHPAFADLVRGLADPTAHEIDVLSMMLMLDDQPISIHYGFLHNRRYYAFMAARNPQFDASSPGKVHLEHVLAACHALGVETVDLLAPEMPYKMVWATGTVEATDYGTTWTWRGWLAIDVWRRHARPLSRSAFLALPGVLRQKVAARFRAPRT